MPGGRCGPLLSKAVVMSQSRCDDPLIRHRGTLDLWQLVCVLDTESHHVCGLPSGGVVSKVSSTCTIRERARRQFWWVSSFREIPGLDVPSQLLIVSVGP